MPTTPSQTPFPMPCSTSRRASAAIGAGAIMFALAALLPPHALAQQAGSQTSPATQGQPQAELPSITSKLQSDAAAITPLVSSALARDFLAAAPKLPDPGTRMVYRNREKGIAVSKRVYDSMPPTEQAGLTPRPCSPQFYYETAYGSPLVYARVLDLAAPHLASHPALDSSDRPKLLDFGYGTIGQLRLLAECGFEAHGVDVEPLFEALYSEPTDTGPIGKGSVAIHTGQWPAEPALRDAIGQGCSIITSKNTLKAGYIHPTPPEGQVVDEKKLVKLGVSDAIFLKYVHDALKPGGVFIIYNICPAQNPPDKEYIPWADGKCPWPRASLEEEGFEVIAYDAVDQAWVLDCFAKLGYTGDKPRDEAAKDLFCWYTIMKRKD